MARHTRLLTATIISLLILGSDAVSASPRERGNAVKSKAVATVSCLRAKLASIGAAPPQTKDQNYQVKALFGRISPDDQPNEIHLLAYGANQRNATLYEAYLAKAGDRISVTIGQWATFTSSSAGLVPDELPGGLATHQRLVNAERKIAQEPALMLTDAEVRSVQAACIWKP